MRSRRLVLIIAVAATAVPALCATFQPSPQDPSGTVAVSTPGTVADLAPVRIDDRHETPTVAGWTFESVGYARDVGRKRVVRVGPEGDSTLEAASIGRAAVLRGTSMTARGDLVSAPFSLAPYRVVEVELRYRVFAGEPNVMVGLRPTDDRRLVDLEFLPNARRRTARRVTVRVHSCAHEGPYSLAISVGGEGAFEVHSLSAREVDDHERPTGPLVVLDIRSADPDLAPNPNFARVANVFGFPSVEYVHYREFDEDAFEALDPALVVLPGLVSSKGVDSSAMDAVVREVAKRDVPIVGTCLGHQVLARAHGASLRRSKEEEWGPTVVEVVERDPLFDGLPRGSTFVNSESHRFEVARPIGRMQLLASSAACPTQVFRYRGKKWYTFQGHIERGWEVASPEAVLLWKNMLRRWRVVD